MKSCYYIRLTPSKIAIADLCDYFGSGMIITRITVPPEFRKSGRGTTLLKQIIGDADRENVNLFLEIQPGDKEGLSYDQLQSWYEKYGFKNWNGSGVFRRIPKTGAHYAI